MRIEELMNKFPATCEPDDTLKEAKPKMQGGNCAFLPVTAGEGSRRLVGVITEGDIRVAAQLEGRSLDELRVRDAMAKEVRTSNPGDGLADAEAIMQRAGIRRLPVVDESGRLLGVISMADIERGAEREREELSAQIGAPQFGLAVSRIHEPHRVGMPTRMAGPAHVLESNGEGKAAAS